MHPAAAACFRFDDVLVDTATFSAVRGGQKLTLEPRAFQVLRYLVEHPGRLVTKEELIQEVRGGAFVTDNALTRQYTALMATEGVTVGFTADGIAALARIAAEVNRSVENIGARRLYTVMERVFEELSFTAPDRAGETVTVDAAFVEAHLGDLARSPDLSRYVL